MINNRLKELDGLRCIAAVAVMASHYEGLLYFTLEGGSARASDQYTHLGLLGVELFFMISGFVILMSAEKAGAPMPFLLGRAARIYPTYLASIVPALAAVLCLYGLTRSVATEAIVDVTMLQQFFNVGDLVKPYWTLSYELWFYTIVALVLYFRALPNIAVLALGWLIVFLPLLVMDRLSVIDLHGRMHLLTLIDFGPFFIIGMMCYLITTGRTSPIVILNLGIATAYNVMGRGDWAQVPGLHYVTATMGFEVILLLAARAQLRVLAAGPLVWLGQRSYSLYLLHLPIGFLLWTACDRFGLGKACIPIAGIPLSIWASALSRRWIEIPGQHWVSSIGGDWLARRVDRRADAFRGPGHPSA